MISKRDVIRMKVPYPSVSSGLAVSAHMYICKSADVSQREFVKCQTLKPYMLSNNFLTHYCDEQPDINRNPFRTLTRIDCDKLFQSKSVKYDLRLRTDSRPDICQELYNDVMKELDADGYESISMNETELLGLNAYITKLPDFDK